MVLTQLGHRVLCVEKESAPGADPAAYRIGEGLPAAGRLLLSRLGVWQAFLGQGHLPCHGNLSFWGSRQALRTDFIRDPHGHAWHLDRLAFDEQLRVFAQEQGAQLCRPAKLMGLDRSSDGRWTLELRVNQEPAVVSARFLVDATGRVGRVARELGIDRRQDDDLVGCHALFSQQETADEDRDSTTFIEAGPEGWWYSALLPGGRRAVVFFTDASDRACRQAAEASGFDALLKETDPLRALLQDRGYRRVTAPKAAAANSSRLQRMVGRDWLAVGDAATSFDPLSSQGIYSALHHGIVAGEAVHRALAGDGEALGVYENRVIAVYETYWQNRCQYYGMEPRWRDRPFWARR